MVMLPAPAGRAIDRGNHMLSMGYDLLATPDYLFPSYSEESHSGGDVSEWNNWQSGPFYGSYYKSSGWRTDVYYVETPWSHSSTVDYRDFEYESSSFGGKDFFSFGSHSESNHQRVGEGAGPGWNSTEFFAESDVFDFSSWMSGEYSGSTSHHENVTQSNSFFDSIWGDSQSSEWSQVVEDYGQVSSPGYYEEWGTVTFSYHNVYTSIDDGWGGKG